MPQKQGGKSKKTANDRRKATMQGSWKRRERQKEVNREAQHKRFLANQKLRAEGKPTPWERACAARYERRSHLVGHAS